MCLNLPWRPTISATCSLLGTGTHSVIFCDFFERSSKCPPAETGENPSMEVKAFNVLPATRPSSGEFCCWWCCMFMRAAARSALLCWVSPSSVATFAKSNMDSSSASFNARWSPIGCEWSLSLDPVTGDEGGDNIRSLKSKIEDISARIFLQTLILRLLVLCIFSFTINTPGKQRKFMENIASFA